MTAESARVLLLAATACASADGTDIDSFQFCPARVLVNEVMSASEEYAGDPVTGLYDRDFIEILNASGRDLDLAGWFLSRTSYEAEYAFPATYVGAAGDERSTRLGDGEFAVLLAETYANDEGYLYTGFDLNRDGDGVWLRAPEENDYALCDRVVYPDQHAGIAWGRAIDSEDTWCDQAATTPGRGNAGCLCGEGGVSPWC